MEYDRHVVVEMSPKVFGASSSNEFVMENWVNCLVAPLCAVQSSVSTLQSTESTVFFFCQMRAIADDIDRKSGQLASSATRWKWHCSRLASRGKACRFQQPTTRVMLLAINVTSHERDFLIHNAQSNDAFYIFKRENGAARRLIQSKYNAICSSTRLFISTVHKQADIITKAV